MRYPVLQSGFISTTEVGMNSPKLERNTFSQNILGQENDNSLADYFFSVEVEKLINVWKNDANKVKSSEFREKIIKAFFSCTATNTFAHWIELQNLRPTLGRLHKEFITDTLLFVFCGKPRSVEALQWARLLFPESGGSQNFKVTTMFSGKYQDSYSQIEPKRFAIENMTQEWLCRPGGHMDMLKTLHVIFGRRATAGVHQNH